MRPTQIAMVADTDDPFWILKNVPTFMLGFNDPLIFVHLGDAGIGFDPERDVKYLVTLNEYLAEHGSIMYMLRGNHDNPKYFPKKIGSNLFLVPDYFSINSMLFVGGAVSPDRHQREPGLTWWEDEVFVLKKDLASKAYNIKHVFTHTAPSFVQPMSLGPRQINSGVGEPTYRTKELMHKERLDMSILYDILTDNNEIMSWNYGHFHKSNTQFCSFGVRFNCVKQNRIEMLPYELSYD